ncbi:MAG TPA: flagellar motor switch protein FliN [Hyphomicrobiaceae bacterium]
MNEPNPATEDLEEEQLNKAIEELRGVLHDGKEGGAQADGRFGGNAAVIMGIPVEVQIVLGRAEMTVSELMALQKGSTVSLDRRIGEPVEVVVNGRRVARGEITVLEHDPSRFGIRLTEVAGTEHEKPD